MSRDRSNRRPARLARLILVAAVLAPLHGQAGDPPEILITRQLAETHELRIGDEIALATDRDGPIAGRYRVAGIYEPLPDPMRLTSPRLEARMHLTDLQALTGGADDPEHAGAVDRLNVVLSDPDRTGEIGAALAAQVPGLLVQPTAEAGGTPFVVLERFHLAIALIAISGSTAFLLALMVIHAEERRATFGALRLIGVSRRRVLTQVLAEALMIAVAGALIGVALAWLLQGAFNRFFQWRYDTALVFVRVSTEVALRSVLIAIPFGIAAGLAASWTLLRRRTLALVGR